MMRKWNLSATDPLVLSLSADARSSTPDFVNDHIWEVDLNGGEPPALSIHTTYGLRAITMRIFSRFISEGVTLTDPNAFWRPPAVHHFFPNYLLLSFAPFPGIDVTCEYWVPDSHILTCRMKLVNTSEAALPLRLECAAILLPLGEGTGMSPIQEDLTNLLQGKSNDLSPVFYMTGATQAGVSPYPSLAVELSLTPENTQEIIWSLATLSDPHQSFELARQAATRNWETEIARLEMINEQSLVDITTGDPDWDAAFALSQKTAFSLFFNPSANLPEPSFVLSRQPDHGYSRRGDGSDYDYTWSGQTPLESYYLSGLLLPGATHLAQGVLRNFLSTQNEDGAINFSPGIAGTRQRFSATPLLCSLAWRIYQNSQDSTFLASIFPGLLRFITSWFDPSHDRDGDGFPEWDHPIQTGFEEHPAFDLWHSWGQGYDITTFESPALGAMLYKELHILSQIARLLNQPEEVIQGLSQKASSVQAVVEACWDAHRSTYRDRDRDTHLTPASESLGFITGPGEVEIKRKFTTPQRIQVNILLNYEATQPAQIHISGIGADGVQKEVTISARSLLWTHGKARFTTQDTFIEIERVTTQGLDAQDEVVLKTVGYNQNTLTQMLPLWAGIPTQRRAAALVKKNLLDNKKYLLPFGLPLCLETAKEDQPTPCGEMSLLWNLLIAEGLLDYGYRSEAARLFHAWMSAIIPALKTHHAFYSHYHARSGVPSGLRHALAGLAPVGLFLEILGVRIITPTHLIVQSNNPFPWPVDIRFRGLTVHCETHHVQITFPDGQTTHISGSNLQDVSLS